MFSIGHFIDSNFERVDDVWPFKLKNQEFFVSGEHHSALDAANDAQAELVNLHADIAHLHDRFDLVRSATSDGLWDMAVNPDDPASEDNAFWWSDQFRTLLGYRNEVDFPNVLGSWSRKLHPEDHGLTMAAFGKHLADRSGRSPYDVRYRLKCRDGEYRWFAARGETLRDEHGVALRVAGSLRSIDDQLSKDLEMEKTLTRFELSREMISDGLWDLEVVAGDPLNPRNAFWWSPQFRRLLGFATELEFPNVMDSWASRLHPEDKEMALNAFLAHLNDRSGATVFDVNYRVQCKDMQYRWFRARGQTKRAADGSPLRAVGALCDIHTEKLAEQAKVEQERYQARLEGSLKDIGNIVEAIELIARQTNLIALNAAIEAARAGQAGRGFSVIANEIRHLSGRTSDATKDVSRIQQELAAK